MLYCINQHFHYSYFSVFSMPFCFYALRGSLWLYIILCIQTFWDIRQWLDFPLPSMKLDSFNKYVWKSHKLITGPIACGFLWRKYSLFPHNSNRLFLLDLYFYNSDFIYIYIYFFTFMLTWELFPLVQNIGLIRLNILPGAVFVVCLITTCRSVF